MPDQNAKETKGPERAGPVAKAVFEWMLAVAPVAVYVGAEQIFVEAKGDHGFFASAEWGIASSFLLIMTIFLLLSDLPRLSNDRHRVQIGACRILAFVLCMVLLGAASVSVAILSVSEAHGGKLSHLRPEALYFFHWGIFIVSTICFLYFKAIVEGAEVG